MLIPKNLLRTTNPENANCCHFKGKQSSKLMFSKDSTTICVYVFVSTKRKQNIFDHSSVFIFFSSVHTDSFLFENAFFLMRFRQRNQSLAEPVRLASVAQWLEHWSRKPGVKSSNLFGG